jgi:two-component system, chemotaxis family, CheB/CheR fusion protein
LKQLNAQLEQKVTERTRDLSISEERFRLVAAATNDAIRDWSFTENTVWWSDSFYELFGYDKNDPSVQTATFWMEHIHPDDSSKVRKAIYGAIDAGGHSWKQEYRFKRADDTYAVILDRGTVMQDEWGTPYRMLGAMMDITLAYDVQQELVGKNHRLESVIKEFGFVTDFMPQMVWATDPAGYHNFFNKQWYNFTGLSYEQTKADGWSLVLHPRDLERTLKRWNHSLVTGTDYEIEYRMRRHDGAYRWFLARAVPMRDDAGAIVKWFGTCTDIHDQKLANDVLEQKVAERTRDLQHLNHELEQSNNELMQFASITSHDLKEPLRKIHIFSTILRDRYHADEATPAADYLERIMRSASRMMRLINDLLDYSRLSADTFFQPTDLNLLMQEVLHDLELAIADKKAVVTIANMPVIDAIPGQLRQIFQNLVSNALKFSRKGVVPQIRVSCERIGMPEFEGNADPNGKYSRITVKDNGIGFDEQYAQKIFVIFQRLHGREVYDGTGIGLAIAKKIVERHNGFITARGKEGEGAEFIIVLPLYQS